MLQFHTLADRPTVSAIEEARPLWAESKAVVALNADGHRLKAALLREDKAQAPADQHAWYDQPIWETELVASVVAAPLTWSLPLR